MTAGVEEIDTEYTQKLLSLIQIEGRLSNDLRRSINEKAKEFLNSLTPDVEDFFYDAFDAEKHSKEDVNTLIRAVPVSLTQPVIEDDGLSLIEYAWESSERRHHILSLILSLAEEWASLTGVGYEEREGLFDAYLTLNIICNQGTRDGRDSTKSVIILNRFREMDLFRKEEIREFELLWSCCECVCFWANEGDWGVFKFLADWDPQAMNEWKDDEGRCFIHQVIPHMIEKMSIYSHREVKESEFVGGLARVLRGVLSVGLLRHIDNIGFLFEKDANGQSAWDCGCEKLGRCKMWNIVEECIEETGNDEFLVESYMNGTEHPIFSFSPLFIAAVSNDITNKLDIVYHLLKKDPAKWIGFQDFQEAPTSELAS